VTRFKLTLEKLELLSSLYQLVAGKFTFILDNGTGLKGLNNDMKISISSGCDAIARGDPQKSNSLF
jgi:hypothetical protein